MGTNVESIPPSFLFSNSMALFYSAANTHTHTEEWTSKYAI